MSTQTLIARIQQHEPALRRLGVRSLALFGSRTRGTHRPDSDLDVLYEFEEGAATLDHYVQLQDVLEAALGHPVDLVPARYLSARFADRIRGETHVVLQAA